MTLAELSVKSVFVYKNLLWHNAGLIAHPYSCISRATSRLLVLCAGQPDVHPQPVQRESAAGLQAQPVPHLASANGHMSNTVDSRQPADAKADLDSLGTLVTDQPRSRLSQHPASAAHQPSGMTAPNRQETVHSVHKGVNTQLCKPQSDRPPRRPWPTVRKTAAGDSGNVLLDQYTSVISDSEDSDAEGAQQPLLKDITASSIQRSKTQ